MNVKFTNAMSRTLKNIFEKVTIFHSCHSHKKNSALNKQKVLLKFLFPGTELEVKNEIKIYFSLWFQYLPWNSSK